MYVSNCALCLPGMIADMTNTDGVGEYKWAFISAGIIIAVSGAMLLALPYIQRHDSVAKKWTECDNDESTVGDENEPNFNSSCVTKALTLDYGSDFSDSDI